MKKIGKLVLYSVLAWAIPFIVSFIIYPLRSSGDPFFETIMAVTLVLVCVLLSISYVRGMEEDITKNLVTLGVCFAVTSILIDLLMFMQGPMKMSFSSYMKDIGITYLVFPAITLGMGYMSNKKS